MALQFLRDFQCRCGLRLHTQRHGLQSFEHDPRGERTHRAAGMFHERFNCLADQLPAAKDHTAKGTPLPVDMFGCRIDHQINALRDGVGIDRCGKNIVAHNQCAFGMGQRRNRFDINQLQCRVG